MPFSAQLSKIKMEKRYWKEILNSKRKLTHKMLKGMWKVYKKEFTALSTKQKMKRMREVEENARISLVSGEKKGKVFTRSSRHWRWFGERGFTKSGSGHLEEGSEEQRVCKIEKSSKGNEA